MSDQVLVELEMLNKKLDELFKRYYELRSENKELKTINELIKGELKERNEKIKELETKYEKIKLSGALIGEGENAIEAKRKINDLVREIDRCVALLNR